MMSLQQIVFCAFIALKSTGVFFTKPAPHETASC